MSYFKKGHVKTPELRQRQRRRIHFKPRDEFSFGKKQDKVRQQSKYEEGSGQQGVGQMLGQIKSFMKKNRELVIISGIIVAYFVFVR